MRGLDLGIHAALELAAMTIRRENVMQLLVVGRSWPRPSSSRDGARRRSHPVQDRHLCASGDDLPGVDGGGRRP